MTSGLRNRILASITFLGIILAGAGTSSGEELADDKLSYTPYFQADEQTRALVRRVLDGMGGEAGLRKVGAVRKYAKTIHFTGAGKIENDFVGIAQFPGSFQMRITNPSREISGTLTESLGWVLKSDSLVRGAALRMNDDERRVFLQYFYRHPFLVLKNKIGTNQFLAWGGTTTAGGRPVEVLCALVEGLPERWYVDLETNRVLETKFVGQRTVFHDYRKVGEVTIPFREVVYHGDRVVTEVVTQRVDLNPIIEDATFRPPVLWLSRDALPGRGDFSGSQGFSVYDYYYYYLYTLKW